jgi:ribosomal protein S18 acetylase RimI-like enzyme
VVIADPSAEVLDLVRAFGDPAPSVAPASAQRRAELVRRRFGVALPPPFAGAPAAEEPVRAATALDGTAIAAVKWRAFGTSYRGVLPDAFLDERDVVPPASYWTGRAMVPPSRRHRLLVWGRPGRVFGYVDTGPAHPGELGDGADAEVGDVGEVFELYVDPAAQGLGGGARLLEAAGIALVDAGFARLELSVVATNARAQAFYRRRGWAPTGRVVHVDLGTLVFDEVRFARGPEVPIGHAPEQARS